MIERAAALAARLRLDAPWQYKAPFLIAIPYYFVASARLGPLAALLALAASLLTILGVAGFAYLLNDLADREEDARAGKANFAAGRGPLELGAWLALFLVLALAPWGAVLPLTPATLLLMAFELALFLAYSLPPLRLKDRAGLGALADALYAHAVPAVLAALAFAALARTPRAELLPFVASLGAWQLVSGLRNILLHQLKDHAADLGAGARTWAIAMGPARGERLLQRVLVPLELVLFAGFALVVTRRLPWYLPGLALGVAYISFFRWRKREPFDFRSVLFFYVDDLYVEWTPVLILLGATFRYPPAGLLLALHIALFRKNALRRAWYDLRELREGPGA